MRRVHLSDLNLAARVLMPVPVYQRSDAIKRLITYAHAADKFRKRMGRVHPKWGAGRLSDVCLPTPMAKGSEGCDVQYLLCLAQVSYALAMKNSDM